MFLDAFCFHFIVCIFSSSIDVVRHGHGKVRDEALLELIELEHFTLTGMSNTGVKHETFLLSALNKGVLRV